MSWEKESHILLQKQSFVYESPPAISISISSFSLQEYVFPWYLTRDWHKNGNKKKKMQALVAGSSVFHTWTPFPVFHFLLWLVHFLQILIWTSSRYRRGVCSKRFGNCFTKSSGIINPGEIFFSFSPFLLLFDLSRLVDDLNWGWHYFLLWMSVSIWNFSSPHLVLHPFLQFNLF